MNENYIPISFEKIDDIQMAFNEFGFEKIVNRMLAFYHPRP